MASSSEEIGGHGAIYALGRLPVDAAVAVDIAPAATEYGTANSGDPIIGVRDSRGLYDARIIDRFDALATACGFGIQRPSSLRTPATRRLPKRPVLLRALR